MGGTACIFNIQKFSIHDGPGIRTTVFFKGCPLRCRWCSNPESQTAGVQPRREDALAGKMYTLDEVMAVCLKDRDFYLESGGGITLSGGEVLLQGAFASELLRALRAEGIHTALETTGFAPPDVFLRAAALADLLLYDLKHYDGERHREGTGVDNDRILGNLRTAVGKGMDILLRIPVIPGYNDSLADAEAFGALIARLGLTRVQLLPFHQFGQKKYEVLGIPYEMDKAGMLHPEDLRQYREVLGSAVPDCFF